MDGRQGLEAGKMVALNFKRESHRDASDQVMGHSGLKHLTEMKGNPNQSSLFNLYSHSQPSQGWLDLHLDHRPLVRITTILQNSSQQKQTTQVQLILNVKFNSLFMYLCVHGEKSNIAGMADKTGFPRLSHIELKSLEPCNLLSSVKRTAFIKHLSQKIEVGGYHLQIKS